ncbi:hypothetical protein Tco_0684346, partial [Tanacetum coccineum]
MLKLRHVKTSLLETVKAISESCVTCGGPHPYYECLAADGNTFNASAAAANYNHNQGYRPQGDPNYRASNQMGPPGFPPVQNNQNRFNQNQGYNQNRGNNFNQGNQNYQAPPQNGPSNDLSSYMKTNDVNMRIMQNQISNMRTELKKEMDTTLTRQNNAFKNELTNDIKNMMSSFFQMNTAFSSGSGSLPSNTVANPRGDLKAIHHYEEAIQEQGPTSGIRAYRGTLNKKNHKITNKHSPTILYKMSQPANDEFSQHLSDDEESNHEDASDTGAAPKQQQQVIPQTTAISNIKLPILKKEEYDIWAMEMEHYLEYIDNDVWKVIQNGNSKKRISTGKDGIVRILSPVTAAEIQAVEKERKAKNILLMAIPKEHMRRFHGMDDAKEIWEAIRTRFGGNANSKKMQKAVFKQQFEAFKISSSEGLEKGYDRFQQLLSQLEAHGAEVSTEDANHKFLRSLPPAWSNLAMTMRTKPDVDTLSIDDLYNNLRVFEHEIQGASKHLQVLKMLLLFQKAKAALIRLSLVFLEKEVLAGFANEVIYSLFAKQSEDWDLLYEDLE